MAEALAASSSSGSGTSGSDLTSSAESLANVFTLLAVCADYEEIKTTIKAEEELISFAKSHVDSNEDKVANGAKAVINKYA